MDENMNNNSANAQSNEESIQSGGNNQSGQPSGEYNIPPMNNNGEIRNGRGGAAAAITSPRTLIVLGWISAALTAFVSPFFALAGIAMGIFANRQAKGSGNAIIITNIVLAAVNVLFGLFLIVAARKLIFGY